MAEKRSPRSKPSANGRPPASPKRAKKFAARATQTRRPATPAAHLPRFPVEAATALFLERQWLDHPRGRPLTPESLGAFAEDVGGIQIDSINVIERAHAITVWSRFGPYDRALLNDLIYRQHVLVEYWAHAACFVARSDVRHWKRAMLDYHMRHTGWSKWLRKNAAMIAEVEGAIRDRGPLGNASFQQKRPGRSGWWSWKPATHALHYLWMTGRLMVSDRVHFQKQFDLAGRVLAEVEALEAPAHEEFVRWHVTHSLHAMGAATEADLRMYLSFPRMSVAERRKTHQQLIRDGAMVEVALDGAPGRWFALSGDLPALEAAAARTTAARGTTLLAPFDSLLWHRERVRRLFEFDYRIEVYTPGHQRVHGYYTLPILDHGRLIGRLDAKNHRQDRMLEVRSVHLERWFAKGAAPPCPAWGPADPDRALDGLAEAIASLAEHLGASRILVRRVIPARLGPVLRRAIRVRGAVTAES